MYITGLFCMAVHAVVAVSLRACVSLKKNRGVKRRLYDGGLPSQIQYQYLAKFTQILLV